MQFSGTQLDGVDSRVQHLKKPLIDLRIEALSLHDGIVSAMGAVTSSYMTHGVFVSTLICFYYCLV